MWCKSEKTHRDKTRLNSYFYPYEFSHFYTTKVKVLVQRNVFARGFERTCYNPLVFLMFSSLKQHVKAYQDEDNQSLPNRIRGGKWAPQMLKLLKMGPLIFPYIPLNSLYIPLYSFLFPYICLYFLIFL